MLNLLREGWVVGWLGFMTSAVMAIQVLRRGRLEREKLGLEIKQLRNSPAVVDDRRKIYERLRRVVQNITRDARPTLVEIRELHSICHDSAFRFDNEITDGLRVLIGHVVELHVGRQVMDAQRDKVSDTEWHAVVEKEHFALTAVTQYEEQLVNTFKPYLSL